MSPRRHAQVTSRYYSAHVTNDTRSVQLELPTQKNKSDYSSTDPERPFCPTPRNLLFSDPSSDTPRCPLRRSGAVVGARHVAWLMLYEILRGRRSKKEVGEEKADETQEGSNVNGHASRGGLLGMRSG